VSKRRSGGAVESRSATTSPRGPTPSAPSRSSSATPLPARPSSADGWIDHAPLDARNEGSRGSGGRVVSRIKVDPASRLPSGPVPDDRVVALRPAFAPRYVELEARSCFSFLQAASPPEELVQRAAELGYDAIAIVDRDGLYGMVRAHEEAVKQGVRLVVGCELTLDTDAPSTVAVLPQNHVGYTNLCRVLTESHARHPKGKPRKPEEGVPRNCFAGVPLETVCAHAAGLYCIAHEQDEIAVAKLKAAFGDRLSLGI